MPTSTPPVPVPKCRASRVELASLLSIVPMRLWAALEAG
ncbi:hypothetical protein BN2537_533 [Streptomyces venezuelae]|nr:hypothetical protein BN2537_533 [Streptomyces venezuelae]